MFDVGFSELVLIGLLALIVLGPKRLPEVARTAGRWMAQLRNFVSSVKQDIDREMQDTDLAELRKLKRELDDTRRSLSESGNRMIQSVSDLDNQTRFPHPDDPLSDPVIHSTKSRAPTTSGATSRRKSAGKAGKKDGRRTKARKRR